VVVRDLRRLRVYQCTQGEREREREGEREREREREREAGTHNQPDVEDDTETPDVHGSAVPLKRSVSRREQEDEADKLTQREKERERTRDRKRERDRHRSWALPMLVRSTSSAGCRTSREEER
jgi:hypothetical protein